jgi:hypothetical protein
MNEWKKRAAYLRRRLGRIKQWHLVVVFIILLVITLVGLRQNNLGMVELRAQVTEADKSLDWAAVNRSAENLHAYVNQHMNTDTGQIALQHLYDADVEKAFSAANTEIDSSAYTTATENCKQLISQSGYQGYATCVADSVGVSAEQLQTPELPNPALYYISFASPKLSGDVPGVAFVLMIVVFLTLFFRLLTGVVLGVATRKKLKL